MEKKELIEKILKFPLFVIPVPLPFRHPRANGEQEGKKQIIRGLKYGEEGAY